MQTNALFFLARNIILGLAIAGLLPSVGVSAVFKDAIVNSGKSNPSLAERQLERKKTELRDIKTEQKRVLEEFLKCIDAAQSLADVGNCERIEREESANIKRMLKGINSPQK